MQAPPLSAEDIRRIRLIATKEHHPRLWAEDADRARILRHTESGICQEMADRLRMKCEAYLDPQHEQYLDLDAYDSDALLQRPGQYVLSRIMDELSFAGWLWEDERYIAMAKAILLRRAREWAQSREGHHRSPLGIGLTGESFAWAADLLRQYLSDAEWRDVTAHVRDYYLAYARLPFFERERLNGPGFNKTLHGMCAIGELTLLVAEELTDDELNWGISEASRSAFGYLREAMDDDGGTYEGPGYGSGCVGHVIRFGEALRRHSLSIFSDYQPLCNFGRWLASIMVTGGGTVSLGDSHGQANIGAPMLLLARWSGDPALQWAYLRGLGRADHRAGPYGDHFNLWCGILPQQLAWYDPAFAPQEPQAAGWPKAYHARGTDFITLRAGWAEDDMLAVITGSGRRATAAAHQGAEAGAVDLWAYGQELLYDPGYGFSMAEAHSTVQVSGVTTPMLGGNVLFGGRAVRFADGEFAACGAIDFAQMIDCRWAYRDVMLVRGAHPYLVVADDVNYRSDWAEYDWYWQAHPEAELAVPEGDGPARITKGGIALDIFSILPLSGSYPKDHEGSWHAEDFHPESWHHATESPKLHRLRLHVAGYNGMLFTILAPRPAGAPSPIVTSIEATKPGMAVRVSWGGCVDTVVFQPYSRFLQTAEMAGSGRLAVVREAGGTVAGTALIDGYALTWRGQRLIAMRQRGGDVIIP